MSYQPFKPDGWSDDTLPGKMAHDENGDLYYTSGTYSAEEIRRIQADAWVRCVAVAGQLKLVDTASTRWAEVKRNPFNGQDYVGVKPL